MDRKILTRGAFFSAVFLFVACTSAPKPESSDNQPLTLTIENLVELKRDELAELAKTAAAKSPRSWTLRSGVKARCAPDGCEYLSPDKKHPILVNGKASAEAKISTTMKLKADEIAQLLELMDRSQKRGGEALAFTDKGNVLSCSSELCSLSFSFLGPKHVELSPAVDSSVLEGLIQGALKSAK